MFRITRVPDPAPGVAKLVVEGRLCGGCAEELEREVIELRAAGEKVELDLSQVSFCEPYGVEVLERIKREVSCLNCSCFVNTLLERT